MGSEPVTPLTPGEFRQTTTRSTSKPFSRVIPAERIAHQPSRMIKDTTPPTPATPQPQQLLLGS